jgi:hypothetical protein
MFCKWFPPQSNICERFRRWRRERWGNGAEQGMQITTHQFAGAAAVIGGIYTIFWGLRTKQFYKARGGAGTPFVSDKPVPRWVGILGSIFVGLLFIIFGTIDAIGK